MSHRCPNCGSGVPPDAPEGLCPACLLKAVLLVEEPQPETEKAEPAAEGRRFGPYTTIRLLGEGGMGMVYLARQDEPFHREVALKVLKPGMDSRQVIARFQTERQAMAMMDHPNIALVFDAGAADDGRPYFAMEYVAGVPLTEYCDANRLPTRERLELFRQICLAVHHAHQKGIVHRDLKPSNVLVSVQDGKPLPKIIDFGVAKATRQRLAERTVFTEQGVLIGTPEYMSPEQARMMDDGVDTASDIYSLGVLLYELIAGVLPFDSAELRRAGYLEILRVIREEDPPPPAGRLKALGSGARELAGRRQTDLRTLEKQLHGDLEWITMRAIEKDRARRYQSASELAADIARYLSDEPVSVGPPGRLYRIRKFVRKNRGPVAAASAVVLCLVLGLTASTILYFREQRQRDLAERQNYVANLANAHSLIEASDYAGARERLFQCEPRLRGWEWRHLYAESDTSAATLHGPGDPLEGFVPQAFFGFSADAKRLFFTMRRTVHGWNTSSWEPAGNYGPFGDVLGLSEDASRAAVRGRDSGVLVIEAASGRVLSTLTGHDGAEAAAFSRNLALAATASVDGTVRIWDPLSGRPLARASCGRRVQYPRVVFSPDGRLVASGAWGAYVFDARTGRLVSIAQTPRAALFAIAFSPDGKRLAAADALRGIHVFDVQTGAMLATWNERMAGYATCLAFSPDGTRLVTAGKHQAVRVWDPGTGAVISTLNGANEPLAAVAYSPDGKRIAAGSYSGGLWVWDAESLGGTLLTGGASVAGPARMDVSGTRVAIAGGSRLITVDTATGNRELGPPAAGAVAFDATGGRLAVGHLDGSIRVLRSASGAVLREWKGHSARVYSVAWSPDGRYIASGAADGMARVWEAGSGQEVVTIPLSRRVNVVAFSSDGRRLAAGAGGILEGLLPEGAASVWDVPSGKLVFRLKPDSASSEYMVGALAFSPDGRRIASGVTTADQVRIFNAANGELLASLTGPKGDITAVAFSPDERLIVSADRDDTIRFWNARTYEPLLTIRAPQASALSLAFSPEGGRLYAAFTGGIVRVLKTASAYPAEARELLAKLQGRYAHLADVRQHVAGERGIGSQTRAAALRLAAGGEWHETASDRVWEALVTVPPDAREVRDALRRAGEFHRAHEWSVEAWSQMGAALHRNGRHSEAIRFLERAGAAFESPLPELFLAMAYHRAGRRAEAVQHLQRAKLFLATADARARALSPGPLREAEAMISGKAQ